MKHGVALVIRVSASVEDNRQHSINLVSDMDRMHNTVRSFFKIEKRDTNSSTCKAFGEDEFFRSFIPWEDRA
jgi:hypothetical protein